MTQPGAVPNVETAGHDFYNLRKNALTLWVDFLRAHFFRVEESFCIVIASLGGHFLRCRDTTPGAYSTGTGVAGGISFTILTKLCPAIRN